MLMSPYAEDVAKVVAEEGVKVVTTGAGSPEKYMKMWKEAGIKVIPVVASVALARRMERCGADAVVAEGCESGGHIGENTTMVLVPQIVDAVKIPVIAAGGIADGRGIAAAFMLGAKAVQMGTHFVATEESIVHENYKNAIIKAKDIDSRVTGRSTGHHRERQAAVCLHALELQARDGQGFCVAEEHHLDGEEGLKLRLVREEGQCLADPLDDERQEAYVRQYVEERHDEENRQQGRGEEVHLRHMHPVRECEGDALVGDADEPGEARGCGLDNVAPNRERGQEPGDEHVEREQ